MSQDVLTVGSTMRIPLLYRGEYSQWVERFMNYLEEQTDREAMINSINNGDQPLPCVSQIQKIDRLARSLLIQVLSNDIYSLIDSNKTAKDLWDALARHMLGSEYGEQDRKATVLYEYETFKATEGELLLDTYIRYLQVINDLKKCAYSKDNCELNFKFLNNLQPEWKQYATMMRQDKNLMDINIDALYNILKKNQRDVNDAMGLKKKSVVVTSDPLALIAKKTKILKIQAILKKQKILRPSLYDEKVIGLGYTPMFLTHSDEALEIEKFKRARENKIKFAYDYGSLNASYVNEKINLSDDYFQKIINPDFDKIDSPFQQTSSLKPENDCQVVENECDKMENSKVIAPDLDTFSSIRRTKHSSVIWKKKGSSNTSNVVFSSFSHSKLNKDVKRYSRKDLLSCNNSHLGERTSAYVCNDAMNVSCNSSLCDPFNENNLFIFDDVSVRISPVSKMSFRKKPCDSMNVHSRSNSNKSLPRTMHRWIPKLQPLAEPIAKWIPKVKHCIDLSLDHRFGMFKAYDGIYNKRICKIHESVNVNFDEISEMASKQFSLELDLFNLNETGKSSNPSISQVLETSKKDLEDLFQKIYDEYFDASKIMKSSTTNVETSNVEIPSHEEEVFHESSESFQEESSSSSLNDDAKQSLKEDKIMSEKYAPSPHTNYKMFVTRCSPSNSYLGQGCQTQ
nr:hypothetical protein [Tanacetum cinerariifolium]